MGYYWKQIKENKRFVMLYMFLVVSTVAFGISVAVLFDNGIHAVTPGNRQCPTFPPSLKEFRAQKQLLNRWHWEYRFQEFSGSFQQMCPSTQHDSLIYVDGKVAGRTDGKMVSAYSRVDILDCNSKRVFVAQTGSLMQTFLNNGQKIYASFQLRDANDTRLLAYADTTSFFTDHIEIKDPDSKMVVSEMKRNRLRWTWFWVFTIHEPNHPGSNPLVLTSLVGKQSFSESGETDACNRYIFNVGIAVLVSIGILLLVFLKAMYEWRRSKAFQTERMRQQAQGCEIVVSNA